MNDTNAYHQSTNERIAYLTAHRGKLVCDGDTHISNPEALPEELERQMAASPNYFHGRPISCEQLIAEMDAAGVDVSLAWQNPAATGYPGTETENYEALWSANRYIAESAAAHPTRLIPAGWTDPEALGIDGAIDLAIRCVKELLFPVIKMNPAQNAYPIDSDTVIRVTEAVVAAGAVPAFHFGADTEFTPADGLERLCAHIAPARIIGVHMGGGGASYTGAEELYGAARSLGLRQPNLFYVLSAKRDTHIESDLIAYQLAGEPYCRNIACGSDAPYGRQSFNYGGYRGMFNSLNRTELHTDPRLRNKPPLFTDEAIAAYLGSNLIDLMLASYRQSGFSRPG